MDTTHAIAYKRGNRNYTGSFDIDSWSYKVTAYQDNPIDNHWEVMFTGQNNDDDSDPYGYRSMSKLTNEQSKLAPPAVKVFAGVKQFIDNFIGSMSPRSFQFEAAKNEPSRVRLYNSLAPRLASSHGYNLTTDNGAIFVTYHFEKS